MLTECLQLENSIQQIKILNDYIKYAFSRAFIKLHRPTDTASTTVKDLSTYE